MQLADQGQVDLVEKAIYVETLVGGIAFEVVEVEQQAAAGVGGQGIEKAGRGVVPARIGKQAGDVFQQKRNPEPALHGRRPGNHQSEDLVGTGQGEHGSEVAAVD